MNIRITTDSVRVAKCVKYIDTDGDFLVKAPMTIEEIYRDVIIIGSKVIDIKEAIDIEALPLNYEGVISGEVLANTYYYEYCMPSTKLTNELMESIPEVLSLYQEKKVLEQQKRLVKFPQRKLN